MFKKILFSALLFAHVSLFADAQQGEVLERQMWEYLKDHKWSDLENRLAPYFQAALFDGARGKEQYMSHAKTVNISDFILSNFKVTEGHGIIVVTYDVEVAETLQGTRLSSRAVRLSVWQENSGHWQWIAHAILIPVSPSDLNN